MNIHFPLQLYWWLYYVHMKHLYFIFVSVNQNINKNGCLFRIDEKCTVKYYIYIYIYIYIYEWFKIVRQADFQMLMLEESSVISTSWKVIFMSIQLTGEVAEEGRVCTREHACRCQICRFLSLLRKQEAGLKLQAKYQCIYLLGLPW